MNKWLTQTLLGAVVLTFTSGASAGMLTTLFDANNGGSAGGAVYFDLQIGPNDLTITGFDTNTFSESGDPAAGFKVYSILGTASGNELDDTLWTLETDGTVTPMAVDTPSPVALDSTFELSANTLYGIALVMPESLPHEYTDGDRTTPATYPPFGNGADGTNQEYSNADLTLLAGSASNVPFEGTVFQPRVWNGTIYYDVAESPDPVPEPATLLILGLSLAGLAAGSRRRAA